MTQKRAVLFFTSGLGDYVAYGYPALRRLAERFASVELVALDACRDLAGYLGGFARSHFLDPRQITDERFFTDFFQSRYGGPEWTFFNAGLSPVLCRLLGKIPTVQEGAAGRVHGIYRVGARFCASSPAGEIEIDCRIAPRLLPYTPHAGLSRRDRMLGALELPGFGAERLPLGCLAAERPLPGNGKKLVALEYRSHTWKSREYGAGQELAERLRALGHEVWIPSDHPTPMREFFERLNTADLIVSVDTFLLDLGVYAHIPVLGLVGPTDPSALGLSRWMRGRQPCQPCYAPDCAFLNPASSCLSGLPPGRVAQEAAAMLADPPAPEGGVEIAAAPHRWAQPGRTLHLFCIHGLGDAVRFALPLALQYARSGVSTRLHVRSDLAPCLGEQPELAGVCGVDAQALREAVNRPYAEFAGFVAAYLNGCQALDQAVVLGSGSFDQETARRLQAVGVPVWAFEVDAGRRRYTGRGALWVGLEDREKCLDTLCRLHGLEAPLAGSWTLRPDPEKRAHPYGKSGRRLVGVHGRTLVQAKCYPHTARLVELLSDRFEVWNFDSAPCESLARLAWIIRDSAAVLTIDTLILHLANALGVPALLMQGEVWLHPEAAPYRVSAAAPGAYPAPRLRMDRGRQTLAGLAPERAAEEFARFVENPDDRHAWATGRPD